MSHRVSTDRRRAVRRSQFAILFVLTLSLGIISPSAGAAPNESGPTASVARLPLRFEPNVGQTDARVRFVARGAGYGVFLTATEAVLALDGGGASERVLRLRLAGANRSPALSGERTLAGTSSYFTGSDPSRWREGVPGYGAVRSANVYPGVDAIFYGNDRRLEYDFVVAPGADPTAVRLAFAGADRIALDEAGDLVLHVDGREIRQRAPVAYQVAAGVRRPVACAYRIEGGEVRLAVGAYDRARELVVDPVLNYSTYLGGSGVDRATAIAVDSFGSAYVTGSTTSVDFPTEFALPIPVRGRDAFVARLDPTGSSLVFSTYLGGSDDDGGTAIALDAAGNAYVTGNTKSVDFPSAGALFTRRGAGDDVFVAKISADGRTLLGAGAFGGAADDNPAAIAVDAAGAVYITGATKSSDYPTQLPFQISSGGGDRDAFITKLTPALSALAFSTYLGGSDADDGNGIAIDGAGNVVVAGGTRSPNFPTRRALQGANAGGRDAFVTAVASTGTEIVYSTFLGGSGADFATSLAIAPDGSIFLTGQTMSNDFPTEGSLAANAGNGDVFVAELDAAATDLLFSTFVGGTGEDQANAIAVDPAGAAYIVGFTASTDFPTKLPLQIETNDLNDDAFVAKINASGTRLGYSTYFGGNSLDRALGVAVDASGNAYVVGVTLSTNLPTQNPIQTDRDAEDAFIAKIGNSFVDLSVTLSATPEPVRSESNLTYTITVQNSGADTAGNVVVTFATPAGTTFVSAEASAGTCTTPAPGSAGTVSCLVGTLAPGATATLTVVVKVTAPEGATVDATASVTSTATDVNPANDTASAHSTVIVAVDPPIITTVTRLVEDGKPFRIRIDGSNFQPGILVFIGDDATPWPFVKYKNTTRVTLKGTDLKARFPKNIPVRIRLLNPDGGEATTTFTR